MKPSDRRWALISAAILLVGFCSACREPAVRTHAFSHAVQNYDSDEVSISVSPVESTSIAKSYALLVATIMDKNGKRLPGKRVEWIIASETGGVGDIVMVDESGLFLADRGNKWNNAFAVTYTNQFDHDIEKAKEGGPDINALLGRTGRGAKILKGQTWIVVTSPVGGTTRVVAYAPGILDSEKQRAYSAIHWFDAEADFPPPSAICKAGAPHKMTCRVKRISDGEPLQGFPVRWTVAEGGTDAYFLPGQKKSVIVDTDRLGISEVSLCQAKPVVGRNDVEVAALSPSSGEQSVESLWEGRLGSMTITREWCLPVLRLGLAGLGTVLEGDATEYTVAISNSGRTSATEAALTVVLPEGASYLSSHPGGRVRGKEIAWELDTLDPGSEREIVFAVRMTQEGEGVFRGGLTCKENVGVDASLGVKIVMPRLTISKTGPATMLRGTAATYKVTVSDVGTALATNVVVTENVAPGFKAKDDMQQTVWQVGALDPGKSVEREYSYIAEREGKSTQSATVTADRGLKEEAKIVTIVTAPQLAVTLSGPEKRYVNQTLRYQIVVTNTGTAPASHVVITNKVPDGFRFLEAGVNGSYDQASHTVTWNLLSVPAGERASVDATAKAEQIGKFVNSAAASADGGLFAKGEAVTAVEGIAALKVEAYDLYDPVEIGTEAEYIVNITNQGTGNATEVALSGSYPREMEFVSGEGPTAVEKSKGGFACQPLATLPPGTKTTYRIVLKALAPRDARFEISLSAKELSEPVVEQESTRIVE